MPHTDIIYRSQAWGFMLAGGALYNNLDYSFTVGKEDGTYAIDARTPGWGHPEYRKQLKIMKNFIESFDFIRMKPDNSILQVIKGNISDFQVLAETGKQYAIYFEKAKSASIELAISNGKFYAEWLNPISGVKTKTENLTSNNGKIAISCPDFDEDLVLKLLRLP